MKNYRNNELLNRVVNGSRYESDIEVNITSHKPSLIDRRKGLLMVEYDASNKLIQLDVNMKPVHRWLFEEDLEYPSIFCTSKQAYLEEIKTSSLYDSTLHSILLNGIPEKEYIYFEKKSSDLNEASISELISHYGKSDISQQREIQLFLEVNGVYKIPLITKINPRYQIVLESNSIGRSNQIRLVSDGWATAEKVLIKQNVEF